MFKRNMEPQYSEPEMIDEVWMRDESGELVKLEATEADDNDP